MSLLPGFFNFDELDELETDELFEVLEEGDLCKDVESFDEGDLFEEALWDDLGVGDLLMEIPLEDLL